MEDDVAAPLDPRRWWTLGFMLMAGVIVVVDTTVLNVSVPTIRRELDTSLAAVQWVLTGYGLVFASLLVLGGRLGDLFGPRRVAIVGIATFGVGSVVASQSTNIAMLLVGEGLIEGIGAALMLPSTLSLLATTFKGRELGTAYAAWAAALSSGSILGPVLGGYLTTYHSWRWAFRINVVIAPIVVIALLVLGRRDEPRRQRPNFDVAGMALVTLGSFLVVFGVSQGNSYGFLTPITDFSVGGVVVWPEAAPISLVPVAIAAGLLTILGFVRLERGREGRGADALFAISQFRIRSFSSATVIGCFIGFSQVGTSYCLALFLQGSRGLTPVQNGLWVLPAGIGSVIGAPVGGRLGRWLDPTVVLRIGIGIHAGALLAVAALFATDSPYWLIGPALGVYGFGNGIAFSQLNRILLHDIDHVRVGAATGMSTTIRQVASTCGIAANGAVFAAVASRHGIDGAVVPAMLMSATMLVLGTAMAFRLEPIGGDAPPEPTAIAETEAQAQASGHALTVAEPDR
jgi:MFS family permease